MDYDAVLYTHMYAAFGVSATLSYADSEDDVSLTVIDQTKGVTVGEPPEVQTVMPVARVRMSELTAASVQLTELDAADITFNSQTWRIKSHRLRPSPAGELSGEVDLILMNEGG